METTDVAQAVANAQAVQDALVDDATDKLAVAVELRIEQNNRFLEELADFEPRPEKRRAANDLIQPATYINGR
jgi:hypothetical protein